MDEPGFVRSSQLELGHPATDASNFCEQGVRPAGGKGCGSSRRRGRTGEGGGVEGVEGGEGGEGQNNGGGKVEL